MEEVGNFWWLRLQLSTAEGVGSVPGVEELRSHMLLVQKLENKHLFLYFNLKKKKKAY